MTQNRVNSALRHVPEAVKQAGVRVAQGTPAALLIVSLFSSDGGNDYLGSYASLQIEEELARMAGVGEVKVLGQSTHALRVLLDPDKLAQRRLNADEVRRLLGTEKAAGIDPEKWANLIVKTDGEGRIVRLRDVARVEFGAGWRRSATLLDGRPSAALVVYPTGTIGSQEMAVALRKKLANLRVRLPKGLDLKAIFDFTGDGANAGRRPAEYLLLDLDLPITAAAEHTEKALRSCDRLLRAVPGVEHTLALTENPFDLFGSGPCILVRLVDQRIDREKVIDLIRTRLAALEEASVRIRDLTQRGRVPGFAYPIDLALDGPETARVRAWATELGGRLARSKKLSDVWVNRDAAARPHRFVDIDREAAANRGVSLLDVMDTLRVCLGDQHASDSNAFGRNWRVEVHADAGTGDWASGLRQLKVRNSRGQMVPLNALAKLRETTQPLALHFLDGRPMLEITANPAPGVSVEHARRLCETAAEAARTDLGLGAAYRLTWLPH